MLGSRVLEIHYKNWKSAIEVVDATTSQELYVVVTNDPGRTLVIKDAGGQVIGSTKRHTWSPKIDVETGSDKFDKNVFQMASSNMLSFSYSFSSPAFGHQEMMWKIKLFRLKIGFTLIDARGTSIAEFESAPFTNSKVGRLVVSDLVQDHDTLTEVVSTLLTLVYSKLKVNETAAFIR